MFDFFQLIRNENMKIYKRLRTWIMLGILLALCLGISSMMYAFSGDTQLDMWSVMYIEATVLIMCTTIFAVVISAESVAGEFSAGTIKLLLIRPWSRSKILLSKYIALLQFALFFIVVSILFSLLVNALFFGTASDEMGNLGFGLTTELKPLEFILRLYLYNFITLIVTVTMSFLISTVFRSGALSISLALILLFGGSIITNIFNLLDYEWVKYLLFLNLSLDQYLVGSGAREGMTLGFSLSVLAVYYAIFIVLTWWLFSKRDVAS